ncbi:hypothetical protein [Azospirillum sp. ST 5-10]|uniref:hypothetical protein n=1 Tax=unclassified Azospirillum TaxID=2630922 RepID=UPI003F4A7A3E
MANPPTAQFGTGGSGGATRPPTSAIVPARRLRLHPAANDNRAPLRRRVLRAAAGTTVAAAIALAALRILGWF